MTTDNTTNAMRRSKNSTKCAELNGWLSDDPRTWTDEQHAIFNRFKKSERKVYQQAIDKERIANGELKYVPVAQRDPEKHKKSKDMNAQTQLMANEVRRSLRTIASERGLATFTRFHDATLPKLRQALYKVMTKEEVSVLEKEIKQKFKENPHTPKEINEDGYRKPGPARNKDGVTDPKTLRERAMGRESSNRGAAKRRALYEEAAKYEAMPPLSHFQNDEDICNILRKYVSDEDIKRIKEEAVREYNESIQDEKVPRKESRSASLLDQFFDTYPEVTRASKVALLSDEDHKKYKNFLDEKDPERVERRQELNRQQEAKPETYFTRIRNEARYKNRPFEISLEAALQLVNERCYYCNNDFEGLGVDAFDHRLGFVPGNVRSCCTPCNKMKADYHGEDFVRIMCNIGATHSSQVNWTPNYTFLVQMRDVYSCSFDGYKHQAKRKERRWEISQTDFNRIVSQPCHYCRISNRNVGLDRVNSEPYYTIDNVLPCCGSCNRVKRGYKYEFFITKAVQISQYWTAKA